MNPIQILRELGQSVWLDFVDRNLIASGKLDAMVEDDGLQGMTSNPTIFQKAISAGDAYDEQFRELVKVHSVEDAYWGLVIQDITEALEILHPVYDQDPGGDGFVSIEVAPALATDTDATTKSARFLHERINRPNLMVKIPGTREGLPAVQRMVAEGRNINITLIFGLQRYGDVIEAYLAGLEECEGDLSTVASVASFFVSRVDTEVDRRLDAIGTPEAAALKGKAAVAQAKLAYQLFGERFSGDRWEALRARGARVQRPLWASTSTKNPAYPDLLYVDNLIGPDTVNTMPDATVDAFLDHGTVARTVDVDVDEARGTLEALEQLGVSMEDVAATLEEEGVAAFSKSYDELLQALQDKAASLST
jgi:transaldolase